MKRLFKTSSRLPYFLEIFSHISWWQFFLWRSHWDSWAARSPAPAHSWRKQVRPMLFHLDCNQGKAGQHLCPSGLILPPEKKRNESLISHVIAPGSVKSRNTYVCHTTILWVSNLDEVFWQTVLKLLTLQCHGKSHNASLCHATILGNCWQSRLHVRNYDLYLLFPFDLVNDGAVLVFEGYSCFLVHIWFGKECFIHRHFDFIKSIFVFPAPD